MKLKHSIFTRRKFLNTLFGGWLTALLGAFLYPIVRFIFPPYKEPDKVILPFSEFKEMGPNSFKMFFWGNKPGILKMNDNNTYLAFVGVCTHLDCNVTYLPKQRKFYCACHKGWYDEYGKNISGPPPRPLRRLVVVVDGDNLIVKKEGVE